MDLSITELRILNKVKEIMLRNEIEKSADMICNEVYETYEIIIHEKRMLMIMDLLYPIIGG
jgi:hypothetical protein